MLGGEVVPAELSTDIPLSPSQRLLYFMGELRPGGIGGGFVMLSALEIAGELDLEALRRSVADLSLRHDAVRSVVAYGDGVPYQKVVDCSPADLEIVVDD